MLVLRVHSPTVPCLDLVDLPGLVSAKHKDEPDDLPEQTEQLLSDIDTNGDGEVSIGEFVSAVMAHVGQREQEAKDAANKASLAAERAAIREVERAEFEQQQKDAIKAANLSSYEVRAAWNKVNRTIRKKGRVQMTKLFHEFDTDGGGYVPGSVFVD